MTTPPDPIPADHATVIPGLVIRGAARAIDFYKAVFGAEEIMRLPYPDGSALMHAELKIRDSVLMLGDEAPHWGAYSPAALNGSPVTLLLYVEDADAVFAKAVALGAKVLMPPSDTFWGDRMGKFADPFGHQWMVATRKEEVSPEELARRAAAQFGGQL